MENQNVIYTYKYIFKRYGHDNHSAELLIFSGSAIEHEDFIARLDSDESVLQVYRVYLHEINADICEIPEIIKEVKKEGD